MKSKPKIEQSITTTPGQLAAAFTEWDRRYRAHPEAFKIEAELLLRGTPETYGDACAPYFMKLLTHASKAAARALKLKLNKHGITA